MTTEKTSAEESFKACAAALVAVVTGVLAVVPCSAEVASVARQYFFVRIWAAPATLMLMAFTVTVVSEVVPSPTVIT